MARVPSAASCPTLHISGGSSPPHNASPAAPLRPHRAPSCLPCGLRGSVAVQDPAVVTNSWAAVGNTLSTKEVFESPAVRELFLSTWPSRSSLSMSSLGSAVTAMPPHDTQ